MKLLIQIPCLNEESTLATTIEKLPQKIQGIGIIELLVIDDGSIDKTTQIARSNGVDHIVSYSPSRGLANAFRTGLEFAAAHDVDILVNTDADNQYCADDIEKLVQPIIARQADIVVGCRPIWNHPYFPLWKKFLQGVGSNFISHICGLSVCDATSGFRAYSARAIKELRIFTSFSYTLETLIQAGAARLSVESVPIRVNPVTRPSRLFKSVKEFIWNQLVSLVEVLIIYRAVPIATTLAISFFTVSATLIIRYFVLVIYLGSPASAFWPTIVFSAVFLVLSFQCFFVAFVSILFSSQRKLIDGVARRIGNGK